MGEKVGLFQIYGRTSYERPLSFVTELIVKEATVDEALAEVGDEEWVELIAIPTASLLHVIGEREDDDGS